MDQFRGLVEQYIASLPADAATATKAPKFDTSLHIGNGSLEKGFKAPMQNPQTYVAIIENGKLPYTNKNRALASVAGQILSNRLLNTVCEDMGAVYSIWAQGSMERVALDNNVVMQSVFPMKPEMRQQVFDFIAQEFKKMESDVTAEELGKVVEFAVKNVNEALEQNGAWLNAMAGEALNSVDTWHGSEEMYKSITTQDVCDFMKELNKQGNYRVLYLEAEEAE